MGNLYTDNLIGTVIGLSVADDWEGARREWEIVGCEVDETHSATCVCGKEGLRYVYTIANTETGETLSPIGSSCIKKFEQSDMDEELAGWQQAIKLMEEAARIGKEDYVRHLGFLVSGRAGNPAEKAWERVRRHPLFHAFSALALIEYQCSPAKAALRVARFGKWVLKVH